MKELEKRYGKEIVGIGEGGHGKVFKTTKKDSKQPIAVKVIETFTQEDFDENLREIINLVSLKGHKNIIRLENYSSNTESKPHHIFIEMEFAENKLSSLIQKCPEKRIPKKKLLKILKDIGEGLQFAHGRGCVHLDLKPENILVVDSVWKIADWGGSPILMKAGKGLLCSENIYFTETYAAPEILKHFDPEDCSEKTEIDFQKCDMYSLGMIMLRCCGVRLKELKARPKKTKEEHDSAIKKFLNEKVLPYFGDEEGEGLGRLIRKCCMFSPNRRANIEKFLNILNSISLEKL